MRPLVRFRGDKRHSEQPQEGWTKYILTLIQVSLETRNNEKKIKDQLIKQKNEEWGKLRKIKIKTKQKKKKKRKMVATTSQS